MLYRRPWNLLAAPEDPLAAQAPPLLARLAPEEAGDALARLAMGAAAALLPRLPSAPLEV